MCMACCLKELKSNCNSSTHEKNRRLLKTKSQAETEEAEDVKHGGGGHDHVDNSAAANEGRRNKRRKLDGKNLSMRIV